MSPRLTNEEFLTRAHLVHGHGNFDYSRVQYTDAFASIEIRCIKCDRWFSTSYQGHVLRKRGCSKCSGRISRQGSRPMTTEEFVARAIEVHGQKYSYENTQYEGARSRVSICCPKHSYFTQVACEHLSGYGCQKCGAEGRKAVRKAEAERNAVAFVENANTIHGIGKYDYSRVEYKSWWSNIEIRCVKCDHWFKQRAGHHLSGHGCSKCMNIKSTNEFVQDAIGVHGMGRFGYADVEYVNSESMVKIFCNKCNSHFAQKPSVHLQGCGCPRCNESRGERTISEWLASHNVPFEAQWVPSSKVYGRRLRYDFYAKGVLIEFDGVQHFEPIEIFGGEKALMGVQERDALKTRWAKENGIPMIRVHHLEYDKIGEILSEAFHTEIAS